MNNLRNMKKQGGFTLIELMIVIAILAILMAIAIPAYQDYSIRAKASEGISVAGGAKVAVAETYQSNGFFPATQASYGWTFDTSEYVSGVTITGGTIEVTTTNTGGSDPVFTFQPTTGGGRLQWTCTSTGDPAHIPSECREATPTP